jgi:imidazolonepropionase-like amidohydrolase
MTRLAIHAIAAIGLAACAPDPVPAEKAATNAVTIYCGTLIDGISAAPKYDQAITIADERIAFITGGKPVAAEYLDLSDLTCLPGLVDTHTHIMENPADYADLSVYYSRTAGEEMAIGTRNARVTLEAGFTTVRNVGSYNGWSASTMRDRIESGEAVGPRMLIAGYYLTIPGGGGDMVIPGFDESEIPDRLRSGIARGPAAFRRKALDAVSGGADFLKVIASGAVLAFGGVPGAPEMTADEIRAVADVAHTAGIKVTAHAHGAQSIKDAILAGVDSIEHASLADEEAIAMAVEHDVAFSMDIYNGTYMAVAGRKEGWPEEFLRKIDETTEAQRQVFARAHAAGVPVIFGTDAAVYPHGDNAKMFAIQVDRGMTPMESIQSATSVAAKYIGQERDVGAVVPGRYGDFIAVRGNPLDDISILEDVEIVIKGGERFK